MATITATISHFSLLPTSTSRPARPFKIVSCVSLSQPDNDGRTLLSPPRSDAVSASASASRADGLRVAFAAGGTGGHIYPAVAIADELKLARPDAGILFLGRPDSMESAAIAAAGYEFEPISAVRLIRPPISPQNLALPYRLIKSMLEGYSKLRDFGPHVVVGTGGYVSFPTCFVSVFLNGTKLVIQEQNSVPGVSNWALSRLADAVYVGFNSTVDCFPQASKCLAFGNPVRRPPKRDEGGGGGSRQMAMVKFFPKVGKSEEDFENYKDAKVVVVLGGSLGANAVNIAMLNVYYQMLAENEKLFVIWQTGVHSFDEMESLVKTHPRLHLAPFIHAMDLAYLVADLIISRAGAMTLYEILVQGKPSILIPSPNSAEGHQLKNASLLADLADAKIITEDELDSTTLKTAVEELLGDERKLADMSERALKAAKPNASAEIVQHILSLVSTSSEKH